MTRWIASTLLCAAAGGLSLGAHAASWGDTLRQQASSLGGGSTASNDSSTSALGGLLGSGGAASGGLLSSLGVPASSTAGNAAGVITYCMKNNYLNPNQAEQVKAQLLSKLGVTPQQPAPKDQGYLQGLAGTITGSNGQSFSMDKLKSDLKEKACDLVLDNAKSLL
ncbi:hypothetical protein MA05_04330 [Comamonas aquatica]|uniref:DUF2501 domain-containing protein n=1 Tax=Comamonas aquatica TaxID=225991 RepID=UPI0005ED040E|nr:DUF2501 domain-containing protein [Comamonas aquatica]ANY61464.1 hypothetical protein MA05_04330 [Comamonas aquatica]